jgi:hypothetical protein
MRDDLNDRELSAVNRRAPILRAPSVAGPDIESRGPDTPPGSVA